MGSASSSYTGRARRKQTAWHVRLADIVAKWSITVGGIGTIVAVALVFFFLFSVVVPLFLPAEIDRVVASDIPREGTPRFAVGQDEFRTMVWSVHSDGTAEVRRTDDGELLIRKPLLVETTIGAISTSPGSADVVVGSVDGKLQVGTIHFVTTFPNPAELPADLPSKLEKQRRLRWKDGILELTAQGQWRHQLWETKWSPAVQVAQMPVVHLDHLVLGGEDGLGGRKVFAAIGTQDQTVKFCQLIEEQNAITGESNFSVSSYDLPAGSRRPGRLAAVLVANRGEQVYVVREDGWLSRYDVREPSTARLVEEVQLLSRADAKVTQCMFMLGRETLLCGDSDGQLRAWFRVRREDAGTEDGKRLTMVHSLIERGPAITALGPSERSRSVGVGDAAGRLRILHVTSNRIVLTREIASAEAITDVVLSPKEDGIVVWTARQMWSAELNPRHPEATFSTLFRPVWYEGYAEPQHIWQSSFATSAPEMKLGLLPLIHGTLKATFYAMLFATPLALLAAVYSSEFLHPRLRTVVKPTIEMMASLPSVVLGFLAALVFAVTVENLIPELLCSFFTIPYAFLLAAYVWQLLPQDWTLRMQAWRIVLMPIPLFAGMAGGFTLGPVVERWLFAGNIARWLDRQVGSGTGAWLLLLLPLSAAVAAVVLGLWVNPRLRAWGETWTRYQFAAFNFVKFLLVTAGVIVAAYGLSALLNAVGWDPRGTYVSTYVQRNAFVVGMVMGFAIIPIIFTIADDALTSVPQHLRSASLGCGATPWQTAFRVVVPTAMSGLFSAIMIGLGRAVGETMIVLMAGGNTPVMEWNIFDGFRTLSANIAVEMPEAVRDSTHYRTLFLAALTLFLMAFLVNTVAELVRLRFRRRAVQL